MSPWPLLLGRNLPAHGGTSANQQCCLLLFGPWSQRVGRQNGKGDAWNLLWLLTLASLLTHLCCPCTADTPVPGRSLCASGCPGRVKMCSGWTQALAV